MTSFCVKYSALITFTAQIYGIWQMHYVISFHAGESLIKNFIAVFHSKSNFSSYYVVHVIIFFEGLQVFCICSSFFKPFTTFTTSFLIKFLPKTLKSRQLFARITKVSLQSLNCFATYFMYSFIGFQKSDNCKNNFFRG